MMMGMWGRAGRKAVIGAAVLAAGLMLGAAGPPDQEWAQLIQRLQSPQAPSQRQLLAENTGTDGIQITESGLQIRVLKSGNPARPSPKADGRVRVHYELRLANAKVVDSSYQRGQPSEFGVGALIPAWKEALTLMHPGDDWILFVKPELGYGSRAIPPGCGAPDKPCGIPSNSVLIFRVQLLDVLG